MNLVELLIQNKIAKNTFQSAHIVNGLKLWECGNEEQALQKARLYRAWRDSGHLKKTDRRGAFDLANNGQAVKPLLSDKPVKHGDYDNE